MSDIRFENFAKALETKAIEILFPKKEKIPTPKNRVWTAVILATLIFGFLDFLTFISVSIATKWYYGILVLGAGIGTLIGHEWLFINPFARFWQRVICVFGFFTSVITTGVIGVLAIALALIEHGYNPEYLGAGMVGFAFLTLFLHAVLFIVYFFIDRTILDKQKATQNLAENQIKLEQFALVSELTNEVKNLQSKLGEIVKKGDGKMFSAGYENITGEKLDLPPNS